MSIQFDPAQLRATAERNLSRFPDGPKKEEVRRQVEALFDRLDTNAAASATEPPTDLPKGMPTGDPEAGLDAMLAAFTRADTEPAADVPPLTGGPDGKAWTAPEWPQMDPPAVITGTPASTPTILDEAAALIDGDRADTYGDPRDNLARTAEMWTGYLGVGITPADVAHMMILLKVSRAKTTPGHRDSLVDIAGYAALAERVAR